LEEFKLNTINKISYKIENYVNLKNQLQDTIEFKNRELIDLKHQTNQNKNSFLSYLVDIKNTEIVKDVKIILKIKGNYKRK